MPLDLNELQLYVEVNIGEFHQRRLEIIEKINLSKLLLQKNPYLYKAKNVNTASEIVENIANAFLISSEEGIFGNWLERLAIHINTKVYQGRKAGIDGIDLDFDREGKRYLVSIKSGPNWGNSSQVKKLIEQFNSARARLRTSGNVVEVVCVNGCCYGKSRTQTEFKSKGNYFKICGQRFWELISGDSELYIKLIEPLGFEAEKKNSEFKSSYINLINRLTKEFLNSFCKDDGSIDWEKLLILNSTFRKKGN